jgi:hypothetical protein
MISGPGPYRFLRSFSLPCPLRARSPRRAPPGLAAVPSERESGTISGGIDTTRRPTRDLGCPPPASRRPAQPPSRRPAPRPRPDPCACASAPPTHPTAGSRTCPAAPAPEQTRASFPYGWDDGRREDQAGWLLRSAQPAQVISKTRMISATSST